MRDDSNYSLFTVYVLIFNPKSPFETNKECMYEMLAQRTVTQKYANKGFTNTVIFRTFSHHAACVKNVQNMVLLKQTDHI